MGHRVNLARRPFLAASTGAALGIFAGQVAWAKSRATYGGTARLYLPFDLTKLDPHDPEDITATLLGPSLFETLYVRSSNGSVYSALTQGLPAVRGNQVEVELRPDMKFAGGGAIDAAQVIASLTRSQKASNALSALGRVRAVPGNRLALSFPKMDPKQLAVLLSNPRVALVPRDFSSTSPEGCGAFRAKIQGTQMLLERNPIAPRGGSYLDEVKLIGAPVSDCLRAFEAHRSDLGFLGAGLHQDRKGARPFSLPPVAVAILQPGNRLRAQLPVGALHEALARLPQGPLESVGARRPRRSARRWNGGAVKILVSQNEPWLLAVAEEMKNGWTTTDHRVELDRATGSRIAQLRRSGDYDLHLRALSTRDIAPLTTTQALFVMDKRPAPKGGRTLEPSEAGRQLSLGIVGELTPRGAFAPQLRNLTGGGRFALESTEADGEHS